MKYFLFTLILFPAFALGQSSPQQVAKYKTRSLDKISVEKSEDVFYISAPYGKPALTAEMLSAIKSRQVLSVDLVYTKFRRSDKFDQQKLNLHRLINLQKILPKLFADHHVDFTITEQTGAKDYETGQTYFHGFVIATRKGAFTKKDREAELKELEKLLGSGSSATSSASETKADSSVKKFRERNTNPTYDLETVQYYNLGAQFSEDPCELVEDAVAHIEFPMEAQARGIDGKVQAQFTVNKNGDVQDIKITESIGYGCEDAVKSYLRIMPKWTPARDKQGKVSSYVTINFWFITHETKMPASEMPCDLIIILPKGIAPTVGSSGGSSLVSEIFDRNKSWNNVAAVCDATGSMGPYMGDLMKWFRLNSGKIKHFTFFNDGDMKADGQKQVGSTGGLYQTPAVDYLTVQNTMYTAIRNGYGGDLPENDVEAIIESEKNFPFSERIIWIADNYATPRDLQLLPQIKKPISIIVCSNQGSVSVDYLNIARKINASLHTLTDDLPNLSQVKEGETITIDGRDYKLVGEKFVRQY